jgi:hypothetical protein
MSEYESGKDIGSLMARMEAIERKISCGCGKAPVASTSTPVLGGTCESEAGGSLRNVRIDGLKIKGEVWARLRIKCDDIGTVIDFDGKLFDFEIDKDGGSAERDFVIGCAHLHIRVYTTGALVCVHWDITGCEVKILGRKVFEFDEHADQCLSPALA